MKKNEKIQPIKRDNLIFAIVIILVMSMIIFSALSTEEQQYVISITDNSLERCISECKDLLYDYCEELSDRQFMELFNKEYNSTMTYEEYDNLVNKITIIVDNTRVYNTIMCKDNAKDKCIKNCIFYNETENEIEKDMEILPSECMTIQNELIFNAN